jgi:hypothetical protein
MSMASRVVFLALSAALSVDLAAALPIQIHRSIQRSPLGVFGTSRVNASELAAYSIFVMGEPSLPFHFAFPPPAHSSNTSVTALLFSVVGAFTLARAREANALALIASFRRGTSAPFGCHASSHLLISVVGSSHRWCRCRIGSSSVVPPLDCI